MNDSEMEKCRQVADAFSELYEISDLAVVNAGSRYGYVVMQFYDPQYGFDSVKNFRDSVSLFEYLWEEWLHAQLFAVAENTPMVEWEYDEIFTSLSEKRQKILMDRRRDFELKANFREKHILS